MIDVNLIPASVTVIGPNEAVTLPPDPFAVMLYVAVAVGVSVTGPLRVTVPDQLPSVEDAMTCVAFVVTIVHVVLLPSVMLVGAQVSDAVGASAFTVTVTLLVVLPLAFVAVMEYVEVAVGETNIFPVRLVLVVKPVGPVTDTLVAPPPSHARFVDWPGAIMPGVAVIVGLGSATEVTVTVTDAIAV